MHDPNPVTQGHSHASQKQSLVQVTLNGRNRAESRRSAFKLGWCLLGVP
jgi:hypothetical protein